MKRFPSIYTCTEGITWRVGGGEKHYVFNLRTYLKTRLRISRGMKHIPPENCRMNKYMYEGKLRD